VEHAYARNPDRRRQRDRKFLAAGQGDREGAVEGVARAAVPTAATGGTATVPARPPENHDTGPAPCVTATCGAPIAAAVTASATTRAPAG
jgi:hypothetical protein